MITTLLPIRAKYAVNAFDICDCDARCRVEDKIIPGNGIHGPPFRRRGLVRLHFEFDNPVFNLRCRPVAVFVGDEPGGAVFCENVPDALCDIVRVFDFGGRYRCGFRRYRVGRIYVGSKEEKNKKR